MSVFTNIETGLHTRLATLSGSPSIAWPNIAFIPTENAQFIRPTIIPIPSKFATLSGGEEHQGIYQIDVYMPLEKGVAALLSMMDAIYTIFSATKTITSGSDKIFLLAISRGKTERRDSWFVGIIEINYLCYS